MLNMFFLYTPRFDLRRPELDEGPFNQKSIQKQRKRNQRAKNQKRKKKC
jgi:hypothetical protein